MARLYEYPNVVVNTTALERKNIVVENNATVMFAFVPAKKGPVGVIKRVYSLEEFNEIFGNATKDELGQLGLNITNWLVQGGAVDVYRVQPAGEIYGTLTGTTAPFTVTAKYPGIYYKGIEVSITKNARNTFSVEVKNDSITVEKYKNLSITNLLETLSSVSAYIGGISIGNAAITVDQIYTITINTSGTESPLTTDTINSIYTDTAKREAILKGFYPEWVSSANTGSLNTIFDNPLETDFDVVLDAGFDVEIKKALFALAQKRDDIVVYADDFTTTNSDFSNNLKNKNTVNTTSQIKGNSAVFNRDTDITNFFVYKGLINVLDIYGNNNKVTYTGDSIWVTPSYFLTGLIPYNDALYGIQYPVAGLKRGILSNALAIDENPDASEKTTYYSDAINYMEKDSRGIYFMSQQTYHKEYSEGIEGTALDFINNRRVSAKMKRELTNIGRQYLHEFNDSTTLSLMRSELNKYVNEWIQNRTLASGYVTVTKNAFSDEAVDVALYIKFTGTIEYITIDITIE